MIPPQLCRIAPTVQVNIKELCWARAAGTNVAPLFVPLFRNVRLLAAAVDTYVNREAAAICPPNLMRGMPERPEKIPDAQLIMEQRACAFELRQVSSQLVSEMRSRLTCSVALTLKLPSYAAVGGVAPDS